ncbi:AfsR/SARP family transcriptional regulator [Streptomyces sp. NBC_00503]|uniref:AfsR/SARP family transcriptional regulator n=1 Tax=Streptomyces sp. NBC_00503 TaxID=2903659 RepID=UPI002E81CEB4|nr:BTAD domain-containing putative transcriptional regulator [Streptomyces sp. NBC_00503]WUD86312.1 winged helix-turn-helix domain-containing protein [Streptomyces sp. NBC_00503]
MDFKILGPVSARLDGRPVALDGSKQRTALAALLLAHGQVITDERLTTLLWGWEPPATSTNQLYTYVSRLRTRLGPGHGLERCGAGYRMDITSAALDWDRFRALAETGRADLLAGRYAEAERRLAEALALWSGPALSDVTEQLAAAEGPRMTEAHLAATEHHTEAALALGRHDELVPGLTRQVTRHPVRERLRGQLMTALYRSGRQADALSLYEDGRRILADELGIDPSPGLRALHHQILTTTLPPPPTTPPPTTPPPPAPPVAVPPSAVPVSAVPASPARPVAVLASAVPAPAVPAPAAPPLAVPVPAVSAPAVPAFDGLAPDALASAAPAPAGPAPAGPAPARLVPALLPAAPGDFTGREAEIREVLDALSGHQDVAVTGAPGTGKSALALRAAEQLRPAFPDGQLYADLRTPNGMPRSPRQVLGWFLEALGAGAGAAPAQLPDGLDERAQLYRTLLADRRMLIVLDNAADDTQVRPLLPGGGSTRTLVTGIQPGLASLEGTRLVRLGPMTPAEATRLLARIAGPDRLAADPEAVARIAEYCDRLPLALRIAAARLADRPDRPPARLAARLAAEDRRLDELRIGSLDVTTGLRHALNALDPYTATAFAALTATDLPFLSPPDAAALLDLPLHEAEDVLDRLADARLLEPRPTGDDLVPRYRLMPLVRLFARTRVLTA